LRKWGAERDALCIDKGTEAAVSVDIGAVVGPRKDKVEGDVVIIVAVDMVR
jgi:hypothetical protein